MAREPRRPPLHLRRARRSQSFRFAYLCSCGCAARKQQDLYDIVLYVYVYIRRSAFGGESTKEPPSCIAHGGLQAMILLEHRTTLKRSGLSQSISFSFLYRSLRPPGFDVVPNHGHQRRPGHTVQPRTREAPSCLLKGASVRSLLVAMPSSSEVWAPRFSIFD